MRGERSAGLCKAAGVCVLSARPSTRRIVTKMPRSGIFLSAMVGRGFHPLNLRAYCSRSFVGSRSLHHWCVRVRYVASGTLKLCRLTVRRDGRCAGGLAAARADTLEGALTHAYQNNPALNAQRAACARSTRMCRRRSPDYRPRVSVTAQGGEQSISTTTKSTSSGSTFRAWASAGGQATYANGANSPFSAPA